MCYNCRDLDCEDSNKTLENYNININEYQELSNQVFNDDYTDNETTNSTDEKK